MKDDKTPELKPDPNLPPKVDLQPEPAPTSEPAEDKPIPEAKGDPKPEPKKRGSNKKRSTAGEANNALHTAHRDRITQFDDLKPRRGEDRISSGSQDKLGNAKTFIAPGHNGHFFLEKNVEGAFVGGYELCRDRHGLAVTRGSGEDMLYLMQIPLELWESDQKARNQVAIDAMAEAAIIDESRGEYALGQSGRSVEVTGMGEDPLF